MNNFEPGYIALYRSGELERRVERLEARLGECDICPRECGANRIKGKMGSCVLGCLPSIFHQVAHKDLLSSIVSGEHRMNDAC